MLNVSDICKGSFFRVTKIIKSSKDKLGFWTIVMNNYTLSEPYLEVSQIVTCYVDLAKGDIFVGSIIKAENKRHYNGQTIAGMLVSLATFKDICLFFKVRGHIMSGIDVFMLRRAMSK